MVDMILWPAAKYIWTFLYTVLARKKSISNRHALWPLPPPRACLRRRRRTVSLQYILDVLQRVHRIHYRIQHVRNIFVYQCQKTYV